MWLALPKRMGCRGDAYRLGNPPTPPLKAALPPDVEHGNSGQQRDANLWPGRYRLPDVSVVAGLIALTWAAVRVCQRAVRMNLRCSQQNEMFCADHWSGPDIQACAPSRRCADVGTTPIVPT